MTIAENLQRLTDAVNNIADALVDKGVTVEEGDGLESFAEKIESIEGGTPIDTTEIEKQIQTLSDDIDTVNDSLKAIPDYTDVYIGYGKTVQPAMVKNGLWIKDNDIFPLRAMNDIDVAGNFITATAKINRSAAGCVQDGKNVYIIGGVYYSSGTQYFTNTILKYDIEVDTVTTIKTLPFYLSSIWNGCVLYGNIIYIFGGVKKSTATATNSSYLKNIYSYNIDTGDFTDLGELLPFDLRSIVAFEYNSRIYICGGLSGTASNVCQNTILIFNPEDNIITQSAISLPTPLSNSFGVKINDVVYFIGGKINNNNYTHKDIIKFNLADNTFETINVLPKCIISPTAFCSGANIYIFGGMTSSSATTDTICVYNIETKNLTTLNKTMPEKLYNANSSYYNGNFYIMGGMYTSSSGHTSKNVIRVFTPPESNYYAYKLNTTPPIYNAQVADNHAISFSEIYNCKTSEKVDFAIIKDGTVV